MRVFGLGITVLYIVGVLIARQFPVADKVAQQATLTPTPYIYAILEDTNALLICHIVSEPMPDVFLTATAINSITPTKTTVPIASATVQPSSTLPTQVVPPTPTQEIWTATPPRMTVQIAAINVRSNASLTAAIQYVVTQGQVLNVTSNTVTAGGYLWRQLSDSNWLVEKNLGTNQVWLQ